MEKERTEYYLGNIYGHSYFGSGSAYGDVETCDNCECFGTQDNGFVKGPEGIVVLDVNKPANLKATGGDGIGGGRTWSEKAYWNTDTKKWVNV